MFRKRQWCSQHEYLKCGREWRRPVYTTLGRDIHRTVTWRLHFYFAHRCALRIQPIVPAIGIYIFLFFPQVLSSLRAGCVVSGSEAAAFQALFNEDESRETDF